MTGTKSHARAPRMKPCRDFPYLPDETYDTREAANQYSGKVSQDPYSPAAAMNPRNTTQCPLCGRLVERWSLWPVARVTGRGHECNE